MRQMVAQRKGGPPKPAIVIAIGGKGGKGPDQAEEVAEGAENDTAAEESAESEDGRPKDVVTCPDCGCEINTITGKATTDDGTEADAPDGEFGKGKIAESLDESDSMYNKPGPFGSASDAARGSEAQSKALGTLGSMRN